MNEFLLSFKPESFQPSGTADFSKINTLKDATVTYTITYTDLPSKKTELRIENKEMVDEHGNKTIVYTLPHPSK